MSAKNTPLLRVSPGSLVDTLAASAPQSDIRRLERQLDEKEDRIRVGTPNQRGVPGSLPSPSRSGLSRSVGKSAPISIPNRPVKTTVGFGSGSVTLGASGEKSGTPKTTSPSPKPGSGEGSKKGKDGKKKNTMPQNFKPKPKLSKAERRAKQEAERAAKAAVQAAGGDTSRAGMAAAKQKTRKAQADDSTRTKERSKQLRKQNVPENAVSSHKVAMFEHLDQYERTVPLTANLSFSSSSHGLHPAVIRLWLKYSNGQLNGSTSRCIAMLRTFKLLIDDYATPDGRDLSRDLLSHLSPHIGFLNQCRPNCDAMGNAIKALKSEISEGESTKGQSDDDAKSYLNEWIDKYIRSIEYSQLLIAGFAVQKIQNEDVCLTHGSSQLMAGIFKKAHEQGKRFRVVIVDSRPSPNGHALLRECVRIGIKCTYVLMNATSCIMREVTKVFLSAHALLANGYIMGRVGTSIIAMIAKAYNIPVMVACETYKASERVQTDSFVHNELGDPDDLVVEGRGGAASKLEDWKEVEQLKLLNLVYDVTPPEFVDMIITDVGMIPCTSVPVILRVKDELQN